MSGPCSSSAAVLQTAQAPTLIKRTSSKREHEHNDTEETSPASKSKPKQAKLAPIFGSSSDSKGKGKAAGTVDASAVLGEHAFTWHKTDPNFLLHGLYGPPVYSSKIAAFDIDGTLIKTKKGRTFPTSAEDWVFWCNKGKVQARLREYHLLGYSIVLVSNQCYAPHTKPHQYFKSKLPLIARSLTDVPFRVFAATSKDGNFRKPDIGVWTLLASLHAEQGITLDKSSSFYVGDAAGRRIDHSACDIDWAKNVGIHFYTPEQFFWEEEDRIRQPQPAAACGTETHESGAVEAEIAKSDK